MRHLDSVVQEVKSSKNQRGKRHSEKIGGHDLALGENLGKELPRNPQMGGGAGRNGRLRRSTESGTPFCGKH